MGTLLDLEIMASWKMIGRRPRHAGLPGSPDEAQMLGALAYFPPLPCRKCGFRALRRATAGYECIACSRRLAGRQEDAAVRRAGDAILLAINRAEACARTGRVASSAPRQCPEPQRSQLQALVDRIKADPQAGKAVVGLLRTMRELRKAELAELRSEP